MAEFVFAGGERLLPRQQFNQSGLPCPVDSDERDALAALDHETDFFEDLVFIVPGRAVALGDVRKLGDDAAARLRLREGEMNGLFFFRNLDPLHFFEFFNAALDLLGLGRRVAEAVDEHFELLDAVVLGFISGFQLLLARGLGGQVLVVVAGVEMHLLVPDFYDAFDGDVEEVAVVRDQHVRIRIVGQVLFQPVAGFEIEVVGRLVEQEQIGFLQQKFGEGDAHLPAAREFFGLTRPVVTMKAKAGEHLTDLRLKRVAIARDEIRVRASGNGRRRRNIPDPS